MNEDEALDGLITGGAALLGIVLQPEWCDGVRLHLSISLGHARLVDGFPLPDETDPAPVFEA